MCRPAVFRFSKEKHHIPFAVQTDWEYELCPREALCAHRSHGLHDLPLIAVMFNSKVRVFEMCLPPSGQKSIIAVKQICTYLLGGGGA